jgi:predicted anti-sigma-YlaC factor YlaD
MTCELVRTHLSAFIDAALPGSTMADVWKHVERCRSCHELYDTLCLADRFYSAPITRDVPEDYRESLRKGMEDASQNETVSHDSTMQLSGSQS